jgi:hypothetical protein
MCDTQNYWGSRLCPTSGILKTRNTFRKLGLFPSSCDGGEDTYFVGSLRRANLTLSHNLMTDTDPAAETVCFLVGRIPDDGQSPEPQQF